jgi:hypothetical protein
VWSILNPRVQQQGQSNCMRPTCQLRCIPLELTTPLTKIASAGGGAGNWLSAIWSGLTIAAYPSIPPIRVESINNDLRVVVPFISDPLIRNLHPVHKVKDSLLVEILTSFKRIVQRVDDQTSISSRNLAIAYPPTIPSAMVLL